MSNGDGAIAYGGEVHAGEKQRIQGVVPNFYGGGDLRTVRSGAAGYGKRYGAAFAEGLGGTMIGGAVLPALFHQDPRYYYRGHGSVASRVLYAISTIAICKSDHGLWEPNYSFVLRNLAGGISNLYYPAADRAGAELTVDNALIDTGLGAFNALVEEFVLKKLTRAAQRPSSSSAIRIIKLATKKANESPE